MDEYCHICERVRFGNVVFLGFGHWRHSDCGIGSEDYLVYFGRRSKAEKAVLAPLLKHFEGKDGL